MATTGEFRLGPHVERWFAAWPIQLGWFILFALVTRWTMLGDPNYHDDETLFFLIGQRMHEGLLPYVDIWDRKGPGLFVLNYLFAAVSWSVLSYQIGALLFAALTAFVLHRIAWLYTGRMGAILAGMLYLAFLPRITGGGGQAGVYFNLLIVCAAWLVLAHPVGRSVTGRSVGAMLLAGIAITFKQTCLFDGAFLGCLLLWRHRQAGADWPAVARAGLVYAAAGALPMALFAAAYAALGHFSEFWHAMVLSNLNKDYNAGNDIDQRIQAMAILLLPMLLLAAAGLARRFEYEGKTAPRLVLLGWLAATVTALVAIPNYIDHYLLPVVMVLPLLAAPALQREPLGLLGGLLALVVLQAFGPQFDRETRLASRAAIERLAGQIMQDQPEPRLFVFEGPVALYTATRSFPPTPLLFPLHLEALPERNVSHLDTATEVRRILAWQPTTVLLRPQRRSYENPETFALVAAYVRTHCRVRERVNLPNRNGPQEYDVYRDCRVAQDAG